MNLIKGGLLVYALVLNEPMPMNEHLFEGKYDSSQALKESGFTIIIESILITFMFRCLKNYSPLILNIKDCYYWMKKKVSPLKFIEINFNLCLFRTALKFSL